MYTVKDKIVNYCSDRLTVKEFDELKDFIDYDEAEFETFEEFVECFDLGTIEDYISEDILNMDSFKDVTEVLDYYRELTRIIKKAFHQHDELIKQLRECLTPEEFKLVTEFTVIHTGDNAIPKEEEGYGEYYSSLDKFNEMLKDMFVDECSQLEPDDLKTEFWQNWVLTLSSAHCKIYCYSNNKLKKGE